MVAHRSLSFAVKLVRLLTVTSAFLIAIRLTHHSENGAAPLAASRAFVLRCTPSTMGQVTRCSHRFPPRGLSCRSCVVARAASGNKEEGSDALEAEGSPIASGNTDVEAELNSRLQSRQGERGPDVSRGVAIQLAFAAGYAALLYNLFTAEDNPEYRARVQSTISAAVPRSGLRVLELGIGGAPNLNFYPTGTKLVGLDANLPDTDQRRGAEARAASRGVKLYWARGDAQHLPFDEGTFDAVIMTKVLCSVTDPPSVLREVSRVLAKGGRLGFVEHVSADAGSFLEKQQLLLDPFQQWAAGNCHLHRDTDRLILESTASNSVGGTLFEKAEKIERYEIWQQWPITQQAAGVVTK